MNQQTTSATAGVVTAEQLRAHWQGHRRLTRRLIEAYPEDQLFGYTVGGMRPFGEMVLELIRMAAPIARGVATGEWVLSDPPQPGTRAELLRLWDEGTADIDAVWPQITPARFQEQDTAFGMYEGPTWSHILYAIDNEIHHRGQGYVYLRTLGIEPHAFWER
jgi:uncharacterized damage-inducible protein DinB